MNKVNKTATTIKDIDGIVNRKIDRAAFIVVS